MSDNDISFYNEADEFSSRRPIGGVMAEEMFLVLPRRSAQEDASDKQSNAASKIITIISAHFANVRLRLLASAADASSFPFRSLPRLRLPVNYQFQLFSGRMQHYFAILWSNRVHFIGSGSVHV